MDGAIEIESGLGLHRTGLCDTLVRPQRWWVRTPEQAQARLTHAVATTVAALTPVAMDVEPMPAAEVPA